MSATIAAWAGYPTPADELSSLEAYRSAYFRALMASDWLVVSRLPAQIRHHRWPTLTAAATSLAREAELAFEAECASSLPVATLRLVGGVQQLAPIGGGR